MKKLKLNFVGIKDMLSKEQMKKINGGYSSSSSSSGPCTVSVNCNDDDDTSISCSGQNCKKRDPNFFSAGWVECDSDGKVYC